MPFDEPTSQYPGATPSDLDYGLASNNVDDQLAANLSSTATTLSLDDASEFPSKGIITIGTELIRYDGKSNNDLQNLERGFDGTTAASHSSGASVDLNVAAHTVNKLRVEQQAGFDELGTNPSGGATDVDTRIGNLESPQYVTLSTDSALDNERTLNAADGLSSADNGAGSSVDLSVSVADFAGSGLESDGGAPADLQIASTAAGTGLKGGSGSALAVEPADFAGTGLEDDGSDNIRIAAAAAGSGLTGGGGSALSLASDGVGTSELDLSISPTWTSAHTWDTGTGANLSLDEAGPYFSTSNAETLNIRNTGTGSVTVQQDGTALVPETRSLTGGDGIQTIGDLSSDRTVAVAVSDFAGTGLESDGGSPADLRIASGAAGNGLTGGSGSALAIASDGVGTNELDETVTYTFTTHQEIKRTPGTGSADFLRLVSGDNSDEWKFHYDSNNRFVARVRDDSAATLRDIYRIDPSQSAQLDMLGTLSFPNIGGTPTFASHDHSEGGMSTVPNSGLANSSITITPGDGLSSDGDGTLALGDSETFSIVASDIAGSGLTTSGTPADLDVSTGDGIQITSGSVAAAPSNFAGAGLTTSGTPSDLDVSPGNGLEIANDQVAIATDAIQLAELDTSISPTWTGSSHIWQADNMTYRLEQTDVTGDGERKDSPTIKLRAKYDSDTTTGVTSSNRDASILHKITAGGGSPASQMDLGVAGTVQASITDSQELILHQTNGDYTFAWNDPTANRTITIKDPGADTALVYENRTLTGGHGIQSLGDLSSDHTVAVAPGDFTGDGLTTSGSPTQIDVGAGTGLTTSASQTNVDESFGFTWTGDHDFTGGGMIFPTGSAPSPTTEGKVVWDTNDDVLRIGDGASTVELRPGNVSVSGTPADNQLAVWTSDSDIEGDGDLTWNGSTLSITNGNLNVASGLFETDEANSHVIISGPASDPGTTAVDDNEIIIWFDDVNDLVKFRAQDAGGDDLTGTLGQGGGTVSEDGTPSDNEVAIWTGTQTIEGDDNWTYDGTTWTFESDDDASGNVIFQPGADTASSGTPGFDVDVRATQGDSEPVIRLSDSGRIEWGPGGATTTDVNLYRDSVDTLKTDDALVIGSSSTIAGDVTLQKPTQNYVLTGNADRLALQGQASGTASSFEVFTQDGDGTDDSEVRVWGDGTPGSTTDAEVLIMGWSAGSSHYRIHTSDPGTGTARPLDIRASNNTNQLHLSTQGSVGVLTQPNNTYDFHVRGTAGSDSILLDPADVSNDGGTQNSPVLTLRAKHDSDTTTSVSSANADYDVEFVSQVSEGAQDGHVTHTVAGTEAIRLQHNGHLNAAQDTLLGATGTPNSVLDVAQGSITLRQTTANYTVSWNDPGAARTLTIPDPGGNATFMFIDQGQSITASHDFSGGGFIFPTASGPTPTTEGDAVWDTDDDVLRIGDGASTAVLEPFVQADYVTITTDSGLDNERTLNGGTAITITDNGAGSNVDVGVTSSSITSTELDESTSPTWTGTHDFSGGTYVFPTASAPTPTTEGQAVWDTDDDKLRIGDGASTVTLVKESRTLTGGTGINSLGDLSADRTVSVDQSFAPTWTGAHTWQADATTHVFEPTDVGADGGTKDSPTLTLRAKHDSDTTTGITSASTDYTVEFVSQVSSGAQAGHVQHSIGGTEAVRVQHSAEVNVPQGLLVGGTGSASQEVEVTSTNEADLLLSGDSDGTFGTGSRVASVTMSWAGTNIAQIRAIAGDDTANDNEGDLSFRTANGGTLSEVARFHQEGHVEFGQNGNVGIGTSNPSDPLHVKGSGDVDARIETSSTGSDAFVQFIPQDGSGSLGNARIGATSAGGTNSHLVFSPRSSGSFVERMRIESNGNVGIGTSSPSNLLEVDAGGGAVKVHLTAGGTTDPAEISFANSSRNWLVGEDGSGTFHIELAGTSGIFEIDPSNSATRVNTPNTSSGTSVVVDGSGLNELKRASSTLRHKDNVATLTTEDVDTEKILGIPAIRFTRDGAWETGFGAECFNWGPFADGLAHDTEGRVAGFRADALVIDAAQHVVLQDHEERLVDIDDRVDDHDDRVQELEETVEILIQALREEGIDIPDAAA